MNEVINKGFDMRPIFIFPPGEGGAESYYHNLVPKLQDKKVVLFNNFFDYLKREIGKQAVEKISFEELARYYILSIKRQQPNGPYNFLGWSFGGVLAFEITRQLVDSGNEVAHLMLLDSYFCFKKAWQKVWPEINPGKFCELMVNINYHPGPVNLNAVQVTLLKATQIDKQVKDEITPENKSEKINTENLINKVSEFYTYCTKDNYLVDILNNKDDFDLVEINTSHFGWREDEETQDLIADMLREW